MKMNLPNKLTLSRVIAIPIFIIIFYLGRNNGNIIFGYIDLYRLIAAVVFVLASITDYFDGKIARKHNLITNFGKLMDPLADKMIVVTALMLLCNNSEVDVISVIIVVLREISISSIRLIALEKGEVIAASKWGKFKTASQMVAIVLLLFNVHNINSTLNIVVYSIYYISVLFVVISLIDYAVKSRKLFIE